jgi:hypothetical protein
MGLFENRNETVLVLTPHGSNDPKQRLSGRKLCERSIT